MLACHKCPDVPGKRECGRCRLVLKHEMMEVILGMNPIYLDESNRNKEGRPSKSKDDYINHKVYQKYKELGSYRKVGEEFDMGKDTVRKIVKQIEADMEYVI